MSGAAKRRLRAPVEDGAALIEPPLAQIPALVQANQAKAAQWDQQSGVPFSTWRNEAHLALVRLCKGQALRYAPLTGGSGRPPPRTRLRNRPVIMSGHQPSLFHPGVWFKNFLLSSICQTHDGTGVNLVIDNDLSSPSAIRVPTGDDQSPSLATVPIDGGIDDEPWEERAIADRDFFLSFRDRVLATFTRQTPGSGPALVDQLWQKVLPRVSAFERDWPEVWHTPLRRILPLGSVLATARHEVELDIGLRKYEIELSAFTQWNPFGTFVAHLACRAGEFRELHNAALAEYRHVNRIRSRSHPVPELEADGEWIEVPLWLWTGRNTRRRRVFVRRMGSGWELSDRMGTSIGPGWADDRAATEAERETAVTTRIRPRALVTTMYARLVLSDLFIHGIGGAKYDELTDLIIERFFGIQPPGYVTATATFRLPIERPTVSVEDVRRSAMRLREFEFRPEAFLRTAEVRQDRGLEQDLLALATEKRAYLARHDLRRCGPEVYGRLARINAKMRERLAPVEREARVRHIELVEELRRSQLLGSREFSFVLFPSEILPARLLDLCKVLS